VLQIAYPAHDEARQLRFVLLASLDLNRLMKEQIQNLPPGFEFLLVDDKGTIFVRSPAQHRTDEQPGGSIAGSAKLRLALENAATTRELTGHGGDAEIWATAHTISIGGVALHVLLGRSKSELVAAAERRLAEDMGALAILSIVLFAGVGLFAEFGIRSQIGRIAKMARRLGAGDLTARVAPPFPGGELGSLMTVLNHTASSLELQRRDIEELNQKLRRAQELEALEKQRLDVAVNNMAQGLILYDASERVVICNQQFTKMMGMSPLVIKPGCTFREVIAHRRENRLAGHRRRGIPHDLPPQHRRRTPYADRIDHVGWAFDPGCRQGDRERRLGCHGGGHYRAPAGRDPHRAHGALRCVDRAAKPRAV
jgi:PAS domain-containing protein